MITFGKLICILSSECPDGVQCSSTIPSHYKKYSHFLLAHSRAVSDDSGFVLYEETLADHTTTSSPFLKTQNNIHSATLDSPSSPCNRSASPSPGQAGPGQSSTTSRSNALLLLRSPALGDIKKKKGWSPSEKRGKPLPKAKVSPKVTLDIDTNKPVCNNPVSMDIKTDAVNATPPLEPDSLDQSSMSGAIKEEGFSDCIEDDYISFSPLPEFPDDTEEHKDQLRRVLFPKERNDSLSDSDDLFTEFRDQCDAEQSEDSKDIPLVKGESSYDANLELTSTSLAHQHELSKPGSTGVAELYPPHSFSVANSETSHKTLLQSPQSLVLEHLRENLSSQVFHTGVEQNSCSQLNQGLSQKPLSQTSTQLCSTAMAPRKPQSKAGATSSGHKQTDIGVFFGLKPLKDPEIKTAGEGGSDNLSSVQNSQQTSEAPVRNAGRSGWRKKDPEVGPGSTGNGETQHVQTEGGKRQGGWRSWNTRGQGQVRSCPFYKKIPGECAFLFFACIVFTPYLLDSQVKCNNPLNELCLLLYSDCCVVMSYATSLLVLKVFLHVRPSRYTVYC